MDNVESMKLIPSKDFIGKNGGITFHPKGEKIYVSGFDTDPNPHSFNCYSFIVGPLCYTYSAKSVVDMLKNYSENAKQYSAWKPFFIQDEKITEQVFYNAAKDCVSRKATIEMRTKSGNTLYAVYETDELAQEVIDEFLEF